MNQKFALAAIAMFAVIMGIGMVAPAMAAPNERSGNENPRANAGMIYKCHVELDDPDTPEDESSIDLVYVSANSAHAEKHTDDFDPTEVTGEDGETTLECIPPAEPEPEPEPLPEGV